MSSVWSTALSFLVVSWRGELKIAQVLCLPYLKHACLKAHFSWNFLSGQTINQVWTWKKTIFKQIDLKKSLIQLASSYVSEHREAEWGQCDIWRSRSDIVGKSQVGTWKFFPHQNDKLVNNWKNQRTLNSVISYKLNLFDTPRTRASIWNKYVPIHWLEDMIFQHGNIPPEWSIDSMPSLSKF